MKKICLALIALLTIVALVGCNLIPQKTTEQKPTTAAQDSWSNPVIEGAVDKTVTKGERYIPTQGLTAKDAEGNDLTEDISYSGNVDTSLPGTYQATFSVTDSRGYSATVTVTVTVVASDVEAPMLTGVADIETVVTEEFDAMEGVQANDTVDGNLTNKVVVEGTVNYMVCGEYTLTYTVQDEAGNKAEAVRVVTVSTGKFQFNDEEKVEGAVIDITDEDISEAYGFALVKVNFTAEAGTVALTLEGYTAEIAVAEAGTYDAYVHATTASTAETVVANGATINYCVIGDCADMTPPVIKGDFEDVIKVSRTNKEQAGQMIADMSSLIATDETDGNLTKSVQYDFTGFNWDSNDVQEVKVYVVDAAGNEGTATAKVMACAETLVANFLPTEGNPNILTSRNMTITVQEDGTVLCSDMKSGGYCSFNMIKYDLSSLSLGNQYVLKLRAKAILPEEQVTQGVGYRVGQSLGGEPWYQEFKGFTYNYFVFTSEYETTYHTFMYDVEKTAVSAGEAMEFQLGNTTWNTIYDVQIESFEIYLLSNDNQAPKLKQDTTLPLIITKGTEIDLTKYFTASDVEDGALEVKIEGTVDTTTKGVYEVTFSATDSEGATTSATLAIEVLNEADTIAPVITVEGLEIPEEILINTYTTEQVQNALMYALKITDEKDGETYEISVSQASINWGGLNMEKAGKYTVKITVKDDSGNVGEWTKTVKVVKEQAQTPTGQELIKDLTPTVEGDLHTRENVTIEAKEDEIVITPASTIRDNMWPSYCKMKYSAIHGILEEGKTYRLIVTAKADVARKMQINLCPDWNGSYDKAVLELTDAYQEFVFEFTWNKGSIGNLDLEFHVGVVDYEASATADNKVYVKSFGLYEVVEIKDKVELVSDLTPTAEGDLHTRENVTIEATQDEIVITPASTIRDNMWPSYCKMKYSAIHGILEDGKTYRLVLVAKADVARKMQINLCPDWNGSYDKAVLELTDAYQEFVFEFTWEKGSIYNLDLEFHVGVVDYEASATADNKVYVKSFGLYEVTKAPTEKVELVADCTPTAEGDLHTRENVTIEAKEDEIVITPASDIRTNMWPSYCKMKYSSIQGILEDGKTYRLVLVAKADVARKMQLNLCPDWNGSYDKAVLELTDAYQEFVFEFTWNKGSIGNLDLEFQIGVVDYEESATADNKVYVKSFGLYEVEKIGQPEQPEAKIYDVLKEGTAYSDGNSVTMTVNEDGSVTCSTVNSKYFGYKAFTVPEGMNYFVFTIKTESCNISYKVDNASNSYNSKQVNKTFSGETTVVIDLSEITSNPTELVKFVLWGYSTTGTEITITEAYFTDIEPEI